ncbi:MAG: ThiF family adenylyltransferase, partial [Burkholderiales bacterium]|nr:ThiF family adenylyltransferase [Burkholderiales bacterium]
MIEPDFERRFGGLRRLYGSQGAQRFFDAHVVVVGIGGVGSWAVEALARSGVGHLTLVDLDHIAESNINRQAHALDNTLGQAKVEAMRERIGYINSACVVDTIDEFVTPDNLDVMFSTWRSPSDQPLAVLDACDQVRAKVAMAAWSLSHGCHHVVVGAAGGKRLAQRVEADDLSTVTHDPLLAKVRYQLRKFHGAAKAGRMRVHTVFSREPVEAPAAVCEAGSAGQTDGSL